MRFAVVVSRFNAGVTEGLLAGAKKYLGENGVQGSDLDVYQAPGAFEIPLIAKRLACQRHGGKPAYAGVICLAAVIKGETAHFEFISLGTSMGIMQAMLETETPIAFGVLTAYTDGQAEARSQPDAHNKGREAAAACFETAQLLELLTKSNATAASDPWAVTSSNFIKKSST